MSANSLFLRLEGPMQSWGDQQSKFVIRRTAEAPTKSGVIGLLCAALGIGRADAADRLDELNSLQMAVRIDRPGVRWWDYHTVGAGVPMQTAGARAKPKLDALLSRREYLCDASFLVVLQGNSSLIETLSAAMVTPAWTLYLGRKACPPTRPMMERAPGDYPDLLTALSSVPWRRRLKNDSVPASLDCLIDWTATAEQPEAPDDALVWYDVPLTFEPPAHRPRFVIRHALRVGSNGQVPLAPAPAQTLTPAPSRPRADYTNTEYRKKRLQRLDRDHHLCTFCKAPATTVQHVTYRHAGGGEQLDELRSLCRLCHDAVTMIEYGLGMGLDRINPEDTRWRTRIIQKRKEIIAFRSLETRRRKLAAEEVD